MSESEPTVRERCEAIIEDALAVKAGHGYGVGATSAEVFDAILAELREPGDDAIEAAADQMTAMLISNRDGREDWSSEQVAESVFRAAIDAIAGQREEGEG